MKRIIVLLLAILLVTGCTITRIDNKDVKDLLDIILSQDINLENKAGNGYSLYIPKGFTITDTEDNNILLLDTNANKYYLYLDVISYYHKTEINYDICSDCFYSQSLNYNDKNGYIEINEINNKYFIEIMYNYSKVEVYVKKDDLKDSISSISTVLASVKYNDLILNTIVGDNTLNYGEETFDIFKPKRTTGDFSNYIEVYGNYNDVDNELPNEDSIDVGEE